MPQRPFRHLGQAELRAFAMLETPVFIYGFASQRILWANDAALLFWNADSLSELQERQLGPYSQATNRRLEEFVATFRRGEKRSETWTFYPKGVAVQALVHCTGVSLKGHDQAQLVEAWLLNPRDLPEHELRALEALRHSPIMVSMFSENGELLLRNPAATNFFGHGLKDGSVRADGMKAMRGMFAHPREFDELEAELHRTGTARRTVMTSEMGSPYHCIEMTRITDPATGNSAVLWEQQDVSQLRALTIQLAASEAALETVLGLSGTPSLLLDPTGASVIRANLAARKILRLDMDGGAGKAEFFADENIRQRFVAAACVEGSVSVTARLVASGGKAFWAAILGIRLVYEGEPAVLLIISDIDELQRAADRLEVALNLERGVSEMQRRVLEIASHEFRTPLAVIDSAAQRIARSSQQMTQEQLVEHAERIRCFVSVLISLLDKTIDRAKKDLLGVHCQRVKGKIQLAVEKVCFKFSDLVDISIASSIDELPEIWFDRALIEMVLISLIENSIKYSSGRPRLDVSATFDRDFIRIYARDWGIGIPQKDWESVFLERTRGSNVQDLPGSGLGLFIVQGILHAHGGDATVRETSGPGTTIELMLPLSAPEESAAEE